MPSAGAASLGAAGGAASRAGGGSSSVTPDVKAASKRSTSAVSVLLAPASPSPQLLSLIEPEVLARQVFRFDELPIFVCRTSA